MDEITSANLQSSIVNRQSSNGSAVHRADWIIVDPWTIIRDGFIQVDSGLIKDVGHGHGPCCGHVIDYGHGALMPALVNAHTHLELCALKGKIPLEKGYRFWIKKLIKEREAAGTKVLSAGAKDGIKELIKSGCKVVGEISTLGITWEMLSDSGLSGVWFREFLGDNFDTKIKCNEKKGDIVMSLTAHAPHTLSPKLIVGLKNITQKNNLPFSIHLAESEDELEFLSTGKGRWADFLSERSIDFSSWGLPAETPVRYLERLGILDENTIAVHLIHAGKEDFEILLRHNAHICLCLRSNRNLHQKLPDLAGMLQAGIKPCLGTDSLAGVESLSMFDEMAYVSCAFPSLPPAEILAMATLNGAKALGVEDRFGSLSPGKYGSFVYMPVNVSSNQSLLEAIVNKI